MIEGPANLLVLLEDHAVEGVCERNDGIVADLLVVHDADDMFGTGFLENLTDELGVASRDENELKLALVLLDHLLKLLPTDELTAALVILENQKVALALVLLVEVLAQVLAVQYAVSAEVEADGVLREHLLDAFSRALAFGDVDLHLSCADAFPDFDEFFGEVELGEVLERLVFLLEHEWRSEEEGKVDFFLQHARHVVDLVKLGLVLLQNADYSVNLAGFLPVLVVEVPLVRKSQNRDMGLILNGLLGQHLRDVVSNRAVTLLIHMLVRALGMSAVQGLPPPVAISEWGLVHILSR